MRSGGVYPRLNRGGTSISKEDHHDPGGDKPRRYIIFGLDDFFIKLTHMRRGGIWLNPTYPRSGIV